MTAFPGTPTEFADFFFFFFFFLKRRSEPEPDLYQQRPNAGFGDRNVPTSEEGGVGGTSYQSTCAALNSRYQSSSPISYLRGVTPAPGDHTGYLCVGYTCTPGCYYAQASLCYLSTPPEELAKIPGRHATATAEDLGSPVYSRDVIHATNSAL